jgi:hypothetical protein
MIVNILKLTNVESEDLGRCKYCKHFERGHWLPEYGGGEQRGGNSTPLFGNRTAGLTQKITIYCRI